MSDLNIKSLTPKEAEVLDFSNMDITLKRDGTLVYFKEGKLFSPRCERSERYKHILNILKNNNMPNCFGEMYIDNGCVFDISRKENWNKAKFMPIDLDIKLDYSQRQILLAELVKKINSPFITPLIKFSTFNEGWNYVKETNGEGLVIRDKRNWFKIKILKEAKVEIKEHEPSKEKGTFILINNNRISGTSKDFVELFYEIKRNGKIPIAEIEYPFITENGNYFQPRLRRVFIKGDE